MAGSLNSQDSLQAGIVTITLTVAAMALTDALVKKASSDMTLWQIYVCRSVLALPLLSVIARGKIFPVLWGWVILRSILLVGMYLAIYATLPLLDLSVMAAALYTGPLFIVLLSALFLKETVSVKHWLAIAVGFAGVLLVVRPNGEAFTPYVLLPIIAAIFYASAAVLTRAKCAEERAVVLAINLNIALLVCGSSASAYFWLFPSLNAGKYPFLFAQWAILDAQSLLLLGIMAILIIIVTLGLARAYQSPQPQIIATFDYVYLPFAALWGFVFFGEVPGHETMIGMVLITIAGILVLTSRPAAQQLTSGQ